MIRASYSDKERIVDILTEAFDDNKSVNYIIKQDKKRTERIKNLMRYSFDLCYMFGDVFLAEDKMACALVLLPDKKKTSIRTILLDLKMIFQSVGIMNVKRAMIREAKIKKLHPKDRMYYLWFIAVARNEQAKGKGSALLKEVIKQAELKNRTVYLETSTVKNLPWYQKFGFNVYNELDLGYQLYFMKNDDV